MTEDGSKHVAKVRDYFDDRVQAYDSFYEPASATARWFNRAFRKDVYARRDQVLTLAQRYDAQTVLDVGCGSGRNSVWWARNGVQQVDGLDISAKMIEEANALAHHAGVEDRCRFRHTDFLSMEPGPKYPMVVALGVFDYVEHPEDFLRHMARFATRVIYGSFPGWTLVRSPLRKLRYALKGCPTCFYRGAEVERIFQAVGFGRYEYIAVASGRLAWSVHA